MDRLTPDEIRRGFGALVRELGPVKAKVLLECVANGALDPSLEGKLQAFLRRNPEAITAGSLMLGGLVAGLLSSTARKKTIPPHTLKNLRGLASAAAAVVTPPEDEDVGEAPTKNIPVDVIDLTPEEGSCTPKTGQREVGS
jgi:hypothetical protein